MPCSHASMTVSRPLGHTNKPFFQANNHIETTKWLMGLFCKTELRSLAKNLASAWEVLNDWPMTSCSCAISHDQSMATCHVDNDCCISWAQLCCFAPFIMVVVKSCCCVNSTLVLLLHSDKWCRPIEKIVLYQKYFRYLPQTNTVVFTIPSAITRAKCHLSRKIIIEIWQSLVCSS